MQWKEDDARQKREQSRRRVEYEWREGDNRYVLDKYKITERFKRITITEVRKNSKDKEKPNGRRLNFW